MPPARHSEGAESTGMKHLFFGRVLSVVLLFCFGGSAALAQRSNDKPLTNAAVVKLVKAGFKERSILSIIAARPSYYDLSTERMIELKRSGVSERIILAMLERQEGMIAFDDSWSEDPFFRDGTESRKTDPLKPTSPGDSMSTDIFGSSGGVKGETRSRGGNGSVVDDTITTGSATVRIIKPPAEANAPARLEKTLTLTNASIIELVEAGFSEGTIIRRINQSPVDFDLSPTQQNELRRRRVSDKLITAMQAAMGLEPGNTKRSSGPNDKPKNHN